MCVPSFVAFRGIWWLSVSGAAYQPITWENVGTHAEGVMARVLIAFAWQWPVCLLLWWYFEKVLATGIGVSQHPLFFLRPLVLKLTGSSRLPGERRLEAKSPTRRDRRNKWGAFGWSQ